MKWIKASERLPKSKGKDLIFAARNIDTKSGNINEYIEMFLTNNKIYFGHLEVEKNKPILELFEWLDENGNINLMEKYNKKLKILKDNRSLSEDTNTDAENELYDKTIHQIVEFMQDLNKN